MKQLGRRSFMNLKHLTQAKKTIKFWYVNVMKNSWHWMTGNKNSALERREWLFFQMSTLKKPGLWEAEGIHAYTNYGKDTLLSCFECACFSLNQAKTNKVKIRLNLTLLGHLKVTCSYLSPSMNFQVAETSFGTWKIRLKQTKIKK